MTTTLERVEAAIAEIDASFLGEFRPYVTMADVTDALIRRWKLSILRDSFDTCS